jgi:DNA-directed RNA polymerase specialized sigma24 family protein
MAEAGLMAERNPTRVERALKWLQSGEPSGLEPAIEVLQEIVFSFGMKVCGEPADAEETAQEMLVRLARSLTKFPNARDFSV